ncbi:RNA-directed DNA polymerase, eukaryota, reverse transcriptase zinc-binding domain protein [Tanacetum coccineum]
MEEDTNFNSTNSETKDNSSDLSRPPGFEFMKKSFSSSSNCSTSFARRRKNDIKGFSLLSELNQIIDVGSSLGYDYGLVVLRWSIFSIWDPNIVLKFIWCDGTSSILSMGIGSKNVSRDCFMVNIYGPQDHVSKLALWNRLTDFMHHHNGSYIMFGDMNAVRNAQERFGTSLNSIEADHFNSFIDSTGLVDFPIGGRSFTWMNKAGTKLSKLDRFLISEDVTIRLPDVRITALDRTIGDPYSPSFSSWLMEVSIMLLREECGNGLITGVNIKNSTINVSHLFYADDVIITTDWNAKDMDNIIRVLHVFYLASGLKINIHKSIFMSWVNKDEVLSMASNAGCMAGDVPFNYLGLPIGSNMKSIASWKTLVDRFHMRLSSWKANLLSIGGRLTLIKSVLGSLGGLNIGSLKAFNLALLQKWRWRLLSSPNALWVQVIKAYHGQEGGFDTNGCSFKGIWRTNIVGNSIFYTERRDSLFNGKNRLYHLDQDKDCLIIDRINNGQWSWNWSRTNLGVRNLAYLCDMLNEIGQLNIDVNEDTCTWSLGRNGTFTVKDARYRIDQNILPTLAHTTTWDKSIPRKVNVFMWRLSLDRLPHRLNLSSRGMDIPAISCPSCNANVESANHVFFECDIATDMWKLVFRWCDIPLFQASSWDSFNDWIISWHASKEKNTRF